MQIKFLKYRGLYVIAGIVFFLAVLASCNNETADTKEAAPVDTVSAAAPAVTDTSGMDSASTRPVKTPN